VGLLGFLAGAPVAGQEQPEAGAGPTMAATRVEQGPNVDGDLSDRAWRASEVGTDFMQHEPLDGVPATEQTEVRVVFTDSTIYFGITAFDANPDAIIAKEMERDSRIFQDDSIILLLDTFHDRRNAYAFETNLNGARTDTLVTDEGRDLNLEWDGIWSVASRKTVAGWTAEIAIPISTLRFDPAAPAWGLNVQRYIAHKREMTHWSGLPREVGVLGQVGSEVQPVHRVSMAGELTGLTGLSQSAQLQIKPYVIGDVSEDPRLDLDPATDGDYGLDLKWGVTRSLALDLTYNTDFAEVEVDELQTNLTRFSLYFPEKRDFFLENAGIFDFGPPHRRFYEPPVLKAFFSRRVGLDAGRQVPIDWGARLTGRVGGWDIGVLRVATAGLEKNGGALPPNAFTVARLKRNVGERSSIGAMLTEAAPVTHSSPLYGLGKIGSIGVPLPNTDAKIGDLVNGKELPAGEIGELIVRGPQIMCGYWRSPEENESVLREDWLHTGDVAIMDDEGYFKIISRKRDTIFTGDFSVYPRDVEEVLYENNKVLEAAVVGVGRESGQQKIKAFVVPRPNATLSKEELVALCRRRLEEYAVPWEIEFWQELPRSFIGKVLRRMLFEEEMGK